MEKKKTFKELFAGTGIEPTTDENGGVHYNFNATLKKPTTPIELPSDEEINEKANSLQDEKDGALYNEGINEGFYLGVEYMKEQILNQNK